MIEQHEQHEQHEDKPRKRIRELSPDELRKYKRASMERSRKKRRAEEEAVKAIEATRHLDDIHEFWAANRARLSADDLASMLAQHERVLDQMHWLEHGDKVDPNDHDFVSLSEGVEDLAAFVHENPCPHLGYINRGDLPFDWSSKKFWADPKLMALIAAEGPATLTWAKFGLYAGIPDWKLQQFLSDRAGWSFDNVCALLGWKVDSTTNKVSYGDAQ
jgi:hypothetical protein